MYTGNEFRDANAEIARNLANTWRPVIYHNSDLLDKHIPIDNSHVAQQNAYNRMVCATNEDVNADNLDRHFSHRVNFQGGSAPINFAQFYNTSKGHQYAAAVRQKRVAEATVAIATEDGAINTGNPVLPAPAKVDTDGDAMQGEVSALIDAIQSAFDDDQVNTGTFEMAFKALGILSKSAYLFEADALERFRSSCENMLGRGEAQFQNVKRILRKIVRICQGMSSYIDSPLKAKKIGLAHIVKSLRLTQGDRREIVAVLGAPPAADGAAPDGAAPPPPPPAPPAAPFAPPPPPPAPPAAPFAPAAFGPPPPPFGDAFAPRDAAIGEAALAPAEPHGVFIGAPARAEPEAAPHAHPEPLPYPAKGIMGPDSDTGSEGDSDSDDGGPPPHPPPPRKDAYGDYGALTDFFPHHDDHGHHAEAAPEKHEDMSDEDSDVGKAEHTHIQEFVKEELHRLYQASKNMEAVIHAHLQDLHENATDFVDGKRRLDSIWEALTEYQTYLSDLLRRGDVEPEQITNLQERALLISQNFAKYLKKAEDWVEERNVRKRHEAELISRSLHNQLEQVKQLKKGTDIQKRAQARARKAEEELRQVEALADAYQAQARRLDAEREAQLARIEELKHAAIQEQKRRLKVEAESVRDARVGHRGVAEGPLVPEWERHTGVAEPPVADWERHTGVAEGPPEPAVKFEGHAETKGDDGEVIRYIPGVTRVSLWKSVNELVELDLEMWERRSKEDRLVARDPSRHHIIDAVKHFQSRVENLQRKFKDYIEGDEFHYLNTQELIDVKMAIEDEWEKWKIDHPFQALEARHRIHRVDESDEDDLDKDKETKRRGPTRPVTPPPPPPPPAPFQHVLHPHEFNPDGLSGRHGPVEAAVEHPRAAPAPPRAPPTPPPAHPRAPSPEYAPNPLKKPHNRRQIRSTSPIRKENKKPENAIDPIKKELFEREVKANKERVEAAQKASKEAEEAAKKAAEAAKEAARVASSAQTKIASKVRQIQAAKKLKQLQKEAQDKKEAAAAAAQRQQN